jgi:hypothetical protein
MFVTKTRPLQATPTKRPISSGSAASASGERFHGARPQLLHRLGQLVGGLDQVLGDLRARRAIPVLPAPCCADPQQELVWSQRMRAAVFTSVSPSPPPVPGSAASPKTRPRAASRHEQFSSVPRSDTAFRQEFYGAAAYSLPAQCPQPRVSTVSRVHSLACPRPRAGRQLPLAVSCSGQNGRSRAGFRWKHFLSDSGFWLLYCGKDQFLMIPRSAIPEPDTQRHFESRVRRTIPAWRTGQTKPQTAK